MSLSDSVCSWLPPIRGKKTKPWKMIQFCISLYVQFTWTYQWLHCLYEHVLHSVNALLLCMSAAGFRQCALCLLLCNSFFTPLQRWILLAVPECKRKANIEFFFTHTLSFLLYSNHCHLFLWVFFFIEHISHEIQLDFDFTLLSLLLRSNKRYALFIL